jgi:hypothetical protein
MRSDPRRWAAAGLAVLIGLAAARCDTATDLIPNTSGAFVVLRDSSLGFQFQPVAARQFSLWRVDSLTLSVADQPDYSLLPSGTCTLVASPLADGSPSNSCGGSALTLRTTDAPSAVTVRLDIVGMETVSARRPSLPDGQDYDGDGVINQLDNCKIVFNPGQEVFGDPAATKPGIACAADDADGNPTIPDQDNDTVRDSFDNCLWYPNPILPGDLAQTDTNRNGIGDLCEVSAPISLPAGRLSLECPGAVNINTGARSTLVVDFTQAVSCDPTFVTCSLNTNVIWMHPPTESVFDPLRDHYCSTAPVVPLR